MAPNEVAVLGPVPNMEAALMESPFLHLDSDDAFSCLAPALLPPRFIPAAAFQGARPGYAFKLSQGRLGYHIDAASSRQLASAFASLSLTCRALQERCRSSQLCVRLSILEMRIQVPVSPLDAVPTVADISLAEAVRDQLQASADAPPGESEAATSLIDAAREWRRSAHERLGPDLVRALKHFHLFERCVAWLVMGQNLEKIRAGQSAQHQDMSPQFPFPFGSPSAYHLTAIVQNPVWALTYGQGPKLMV